MNRKFTHNSALCTDFYQLTMAYAYFKENITDEEACFHLFFRKAPFGGEFTIAAGLEIAVNYISEYKYTKEEIEYLASLRDSRDNKYFSDDFLDYLKNIKLSIDIDAVPEGTPVFANEPMLRIKGPIAQCQMLETPLLNILNFQSLIATKAARICLAAGNSQVVDFGLRRAQGFDGALSATRASIVGGCKSSSNLLAGFELGIPVNGTMAHSFVMRFDQEEDAFLSFARAMPSNSILLVDTYHSLDGVRKACQIGKWLKAQGQELMGIRLDSGDLSLLSKEARRILDEAGFNNTVIVASNELDEYIIKSLKMAGAPIDIFGVGTRLITAYDEPALGGVYKLAATRPKGSNNWRYRIKVSDDEVKSTLPGILQVRRFIKNCEVYKDIIFDENLGLPLKEENAYNLLEPIFRAGSLVYKPQSLITIQQRTKEELNKLPKSVIDFEHPRAFNIEIETKLQERKTAMIKGHMSK